MQILTLAVEPQVVDVILQALAASKKTRWIIMDNPGTALMQTPTPPKIQPLSTTDLALIETVREELILRRINPPSWRESDADQYRRFYDEVRAILITQPENRNDVKCQAQLITDALSGVWLLDQLLRDPCVEEIFVRNGEVAVEYDGSFHHLGKLADDRYFENLAVHVADQGGATLRGDRPTQTANFRIFNLLQRQFQCGFAIGHQHLELCITLYRIAPIYFSFTVLIDVCG